jgi:hypothetical protein
MESLNFYECEMKPVIAVLSIEKRFEFGPIGSLALYEFLQIDDHEPASILPATEFEGR